MPFFYVTIEERHTWNVTVEAEDKKEALNIAEDMDLIDEPDTIDLLDIHAEEVRKHVE